MTCQFPSANKGTACTECGYQLRRDFPKPPIRRCGVRQPNTNRKPGLGDRLESALTKLGITQETWKAWKEAHGLPPTCGCAARKEYLNRFGETFGKPAAALVRLVDVAARGDEL